MDQAPAFGEWLKTQRLARDLSQEALAAQVGCSRDLIGKIEGGARRPSRQVAALLAEVLHVAPVDRDRFIRWARTPAAPAAPTDSPRGPAAALPPGWPVPATPLVGRSADLAQVRALLSPEGRADTRLVTLAGTGGVGKTRLALQVATDLAARFADGVRLVELAALTDPALVPQALAGTLGLREGPGRPLETTLATVLRDQTVLLVLDNCEHLLEACARLAEALLRACPRLHILATSRTPLHIAGETVFPVPSLAWPPDGQPGGPSPEQAGEYAAVRLFVARGQAARPDFALTAANTPAVAAICRRLDGIPLALELAAARVPVLTVEQIMARLDDAFRLLTRGSRAALPRQQTLRASIAWSWDLLAAPERALLRRLGVFRGGCTLEAAEAVGAGAGVAETAVLDLLADLADQSLVLVEEGGTTARYRLLDTIQAYAQEQLAGSGEEAALRRRHAAFFLERAEEAAPWLRGPERLAWLQRLEADHDNLRAALHWAVDGGVIATELRLVAALARFWNDRGYWSEARRWLEGALAHSAGRTDPARVHVLIAAGDRADAAGATGQAIARYEEGLALARALADQAGIAEALCDLGRVADAEGDFARAETLYSEGLAAWRSLGAHWGSERALTELGMTVLNQGDPARARPLLEEALRLAQSSGAPNRIARHLGNLGELARVEGDFATARALQAEALERFQVGQDKNGMALALLNLGLIAAAQGADFDAARFFGQSLALAAELDHSFGIAISQVGLAGVAARRGRAVQAMRLLGAADALLATTRRVWDPPGQAEYGRARATAEAQLPAGVGAAAYAGGQAMTVEEAVAAARAATTEAAEAGAPC